MSEIQKKLSLPFKYDDIEWRIDRVMTTKTGAMGIVFAYITSRAVMNRLDEVFGVFGWQDEYEFIDNHTVCKIKIWDDAQKQWIIKQDGADQTNFEAFKGGISDSLKRAAVKLGIGRYLYKLSENWVNITPQKPKGAGADYVHFINDKKKNIKGYWLSPDMPIWALPEGEKPKKTNINNASNLGNPNQKIEKYKRTTGSNEEPNLNKVDMGVAILQNKIAKGLDLLYKDEGQYRERSIKKHLGVDKVSKCHEMVKLQAYYDYLLSVFKEKGAN